MVKLYPIPLRMKLRVLLVHIPQSWAPPDISAAKLEVSWQKTKAQRSNLIAEAIDTKTVLLVDSDLTPVQLNVRQKIINDVRVGLYNLISFSGTGHINPFLRDLVYSANLSQTPIEAMLPHDSELYRYIKLFPVSNVILN